METKALLYGLIGFFLGGLIVSIAATNLIDSSVENEDEMSMSDMTVSLAAKSGDDYDEAFIGYMIEHHQSAVDMAKLSSDRAEHEEIKQLSNAIIEAQESEINQMRQWLSDWNYSSSSNHDQMSH